MPNALEAPHWRRTTDELRAQLYDFVQDSSEKNRHYFIAWVVFAVYVIVTVAGTTDLQLLVPETGVTLPVLGIQMPLFSFYIAIPLLVLAVHFNLLQNLDNHAFKLNQWREAWDGAPPTAAVHAFLFDYAALGRGRAFASLVRIASDALCYWLGPLLLAIILIRFSDYQSPLYTSFHFGVLMIDVALVLMARRALPGFGYDPPRWSRIARRSVLAAATVVAASLTILPLFLTWGLYFGHPTADFVMGRLFSWWARPEFFGELLVPRLFIDSNAQTTSVDGQLELRAKIDGKAIDAWWREQGRGISLVGRNLNYASLAGTNLRKGDFTNARMRRADLSGAALQEARFIDANLEGADLENARLQGAILRGANLHLAMLEFARLDGAQVGGWGNVTNLSGATMPGANLSGADLARANLRGAWLYNATMYGADLSNCDLAGAYFAEARLQGATLEGASLAGAIFERSQISGTVLDAAFVAGAVFTEVALPRDPKWMGLPIIVSAGEISGAPDWEAIARDMPNDEARRRIVTARDRISVPEGVVESTQGLSFADMSLDEGIDIARTLAASFCNTSSDAGWTSALQLVLFQWPRRDWGPEDGLESRASFLRQEFLIQVLRENGCAQRRRAICSAAWRQMERVRLSAVAPSCLEEKGVPMPDDEGVGIKAKGPF